MKLFSQCQEALRQFRTSKLRSLLALIGIMVGSASVVGMMSIGKMAGDQILRQFEQLGINLVSVSIQDSRTAPSPHDGLSPEQAKQIQTLSPMIEKSAPYLVKYGETNYESLPLSAPIVGDEKNLFSVAHLKIAQGRALSFLDNEQFYCLIGNEVYQQIRNKGFPNPLGHQISVNHSVFTIVGILAPWETNWFFNADFNQAILTPLSTALWLEKNPTIHHIAIRLHNPEAMSAVEKLLHNYLAQHTEHQRIEINTPKSIIDGMQKSSRTMSLLLSLIGSISLIVGGVGVMNIMLVSVTERQREIGIRLAIGATQKNIQTQFLIEAITLSGIGGLLGILIGLGVSALVAWDLHWHFSFFLTPLLTGFFVSALTGIFFGYYPARKASRLNPIQALKAET